MEQEIQKAHRPYNAVAVLSKISQEVREKVVSLYKEGTTQVQMEKDLHMTRKTIRTILKESGTYRDKSKAQLLRRNNTLDETVFDTITEESAYWIGFLYADGHIGKDSYVIGLAIQTGDIEHLEKYRKFLKTSVSVKTRIVKNHSISKVSQCSRVLHNKLRYYGFRNDKSYTAVPPEELKLNRHFWRGVIDGDGCLSTKDGKISVHLAGTQATVQGFIEFVKINGVETECIARKTKDANYQVVFEYRKGKQIAELLYKDSAIYLERKYQRYINQQAD